MFVIRYKQNSSPFHIKLTPFILSGSFIPFLSNTPGKFISIEGQITLGVWKILNLVVEYAKIIFS